MMGKSEDRIEKEMSIVEHLRKKPLSIVVISIIITVCYFVMGISIFIGLFIPLFFTFYVSDTHINVLAHIAASSGIIGASLLIFIFYSRDDEVEEHANRKSFWSKVIEKKEQAAFITACHWGMIIVLAISNFSYIHPPFSTVLLLISALLTLVGGLFALYRMIQVKK